LFAARAFGDRIRIAIPGSTSVSASGTSGLADEITDGRRDVFVAQAPAASGPASGGTVVARIPTECARSDVTVARDSGAAYVLPQVPNAAALHAMAAGADLLVSAHGLGVLALDGFPPRPGHPPRRISCWRTARR
jgi:hypothetical protein